MEPTQAFDNWEQGDAYERYVGRWSRRLAPQFLAWLNMPANLRWLDVGCGPGTLCSAILDQCQPLTVTGVDPSAGFLSTARDQLGDRAVLMQGSATELPLDDIAADVVVAGLVLNFVTDAHAALAEMKRVTAFGGTIAAYVWDYAGKMDMLRLFWDAAVHLDPAAIQFDEGARFPLCQRDALNALFVSAGLEAVHVTAIEIPMHFRDFDDYWQPFLQGQGPAPGYLVALDPIAQARLGDLVRDRIPFAADGSIALPARAWAVQGRVGA